MQEPFTATPAIGADDIAGTVSFNSPAILSAHLLRSPNAVSGYVTAAVARDAPSMTIAFDSPSRPGYRFDEALPCCHLYGTDIARTALVAGRGP